MATHIAANIFGFGQQTAEEEGEKKEERYVGVSGVIHTLLSR